MTTRQVLLDVARCLGAAAGPLLTLGALTVARTAHAENPASTSIDQLLTPARHAAITTTTLLWLLLAVTWAAARPWRDRRAFQRLQRLREVAIPPDRALVNVETTVWSSTAGQHAVVVNVATGATSRVWLPETTVPIGAFVVLERKDGGVEVVDWMNAHRVEAGHRHERRLALSTAAVPREDLVSTGQDREAATKLISEIEEFLKGPAENR